VFRRLRALATSDVTSLCSGIRVSDLKFLVKTIGGGLGCFVLGGLLLSMPGVEWWRAIAAFPLGLVLIALGVMASRRAPPTEQD